MTIPKCGKACTRNDNAAKNRAAWGCDANALRKWGIACWSCSGRDKACPRCKGKGVVRVYRCPSWHDRVPGMSAMVQAFAWYRQSKAMPVDGGMLAQANTFVQGVEILQGACTRATADD